ncbi:Translational regulator CsrA [bioreactor metagenome]|uniref:Translational regulator CsrA n=1 Tax=bioreactor metagenome TaxID=1076179 RepID=A0A645IXP3_9ZZZZ
MLVISRKAGESLLIGENIEVFLLETAGDKVKLGIAAPRDVKVIRKELREIEQLNRESACAAGTDLAALQKAFDKKSQNR